MLPLVRIVMIAMSLPVLMFFCTMTLPVFIFAVPSIFSGSPLNVVFVAAWILGGYGIYSGAIAIASVGNSPYLLKNKYKIGILLGVLIFIPLIIVSPSKEIKLGWRYLAFMSILPACLLLIFSTVNQYKIKVSGRRSGSRQPPS